MTYAYDILLNFKKNYFDFFEWNNNDEIIHIKKIPIIKISNNDFSLFKYSSIRFDKKFLHSIYNKTKKYYTKKENIKYSFLISNGYETIALKLNKNGINTYKSSLLLDEEEEITKIAINLEKEKIKYTILKKKQENLLKTRKEKETINHIINSLNKSYKNKETDKLKFLYLECFNNQENNIKKIYHTLKKETLNNDKNITKLENFFKITQKNRG